jgi:hypothetical protein
MTVYGHMFDSASQTFPADSLLNAYYYNGKFNHKPVVYGKGKVWIDVTGAAPGSCSWLDVERFDATPSQVPTWLDERNQPGNQGVYCNLSTLPSVERFAGNRPHNLWISTLDGNTNPFLTAHTGRLVAVQAFPASMLGFNADMSVIVDYNYWQDHHA